MATSPHVRNIARDLVLMVITCGLFNMYVQYKQMQALNEMYQEPRYSFERWAIFTLLTCGIYHVYYEYRMSLDLKAKVVGMPDYEPLVMLLLAFFGLTPLVDALQQTHINKYYGSSQV